MLTFRYLLSSSCSVLFSSCPYRKNGLFADTYLQQSEGLVPRESVRNPWKSLHSNRSKAVLVLSSLKTDIFLWVLYCFGIFQIVSDMFSKADNFANFNDIVEWQGSCTSPTLSFLCHSADWVLDMSTGSDQLCGAEWIWLVRLSQQFVSISKSRCSPLQTSMNWWYKGH